MADQTGATAPKKGISKMEAVRQALGHFGNDAKPLEMRPWIKQQFGINMSTDHISTYKGDIRRKAKAPTPAASAAKKPAGPKVAPKKPSVQHAAARSNASPKESNAGQRISLEDIRAVKGLVRRV